MCPVLAFLDNPLMLLILGAIAVLLFGERLPEVAKSFGKSLMELKNGVRGIQDEITNAVNSAGSTPPARPSNSNTYDGEQEDPDEATAPKFEPPAAPPPTS